LIHIGFNGPLIHIGFNDILDYPWERQYRHWRPQLVGDVRGAVLEASSVKEIFSDLQSLPFIDATSEGLIFYDVVREMISKDLATRDPEIHQILKAKEPMESARQIKRWWDTHPETFNLVKTRDGKSEAFYILFEPDNVDRTLLEEDPFTSSWFKHLIDSPIASAERVLFCRRWVDRSTGEMPSPAVSACFLDIKRVYM
jgi:hypothetical protein